MKQSIINCEINYKKSYSNSISTDDFIRFRDESLPEMYDFNITLIKSNDMNSKKIEGYIRDEVKVSLQDGHGFSKIMLDDYIEKESLKDIPVYDDITYHGFYLLDNEQIFNWKTNPDCTIVVGKSQQHVEDLSNLVLDEYGDLHGRDFSVKSVKRKSKVYFAPDNLNVYLIYIHGELVGKCELFIDGTTAKIEDVDVRQSFRHKCVATTLLKAAASAALLSGAKEIYLVTNEDDTVKDMYQNLGFEKIGVWTELFFKDNLNNITDNIE